MDIHKIIRDVNEYADEAILDSKAGSKSIKRRISSWLNGGGYKLSNKHIIVWAMVTGLLCFWF